MRNRSTDLVGTAMAVCRAALLMTLLLSTTNHCVAQDIADSSDSQLTREQWQQRLDEARHRSEQFVAKARVRPSEPLNSEREQAEVADQRVVRDQSLQQGDIVSTSRGLLVFTGRDEAGGTFEPLRARQPSKGSGTPGQRD